MKKFWLFIFVSIFSLYDNYALAEDSNVAEKVETILQHCYKDTNKTIVDQEMKDVLISEISCKKNVIIEELNRIMPDKEKDNAIKALNNYERSYIELYNIITNKNNTCENIFKCGTIGENMPYELFTQELDQMLEYILERKDGSF